MMNDLEKALDKIKRAADALEQVQGLDSENMRDGIDEALEILTED